MWISFTSYFMYTGVFIMNLRRLLYFLLLLLSFSVSSASAFDFGSLIGGGGIDADSLLSSFTGSSGTTTGSDTVVNDDAARELSEAVKTEEAKAAAQSDAIRVFPSNPFGVEARGDGQVAGTATTQTFDEFARELSILVNYSHFREVVSDILAETNLCSGSSNSDPGEVLRECANETPDEFAAASNMIRYFLDWNSTEMRTYLELYRAKLISPILKERFEGRLIGHCLQDKMTADGLDTTAAIHACREPVNWGPYVSKLFYASCDSTESSDEFSYSVFVQECVLNPSVTKSIGARLTAELLPEFGITVSSSAVAFAMKPIVMSPQNAYSMIYTGIISQLNADWFNTLETQGCLASVFAPEDFDTLDADVRTSFYSVCLPTNLVSAISSLPRSDASLYRNILAQRLTVLQIIEWLNGAILITEEAQRNIFAGDRELGALVKSYPDYLRSFKEMYRDTVDLTYSTTLEDVATQVQSQIQLYQQEIGTLDANQVLVQDELSTTKAQIDRGM